MSGTVWSERFARRKSDPTLDAFNASIGKDFFLFDAEIKASAAYARGLERASVLTEGELAAILAGLDNVVRRVKAGENVDRFEDVHAVVEILLTEEIGETGKKLHTGRSRNEQVATDERLYLKEKIAGILDAVTEIQKGLVRLAEAHPGAVMPGYTHLQQGQCILFAHYILSFFWPLERGKARLEETLKRVDVLPLGSGALAGSTVPIDRRFLMEILGFRCVTANSCDAVSDRSFIMETLFDLALILIDLGRMAEDFIIFSSAEFGFLRLDDSIATSSSLMPQKKNPDIFELLRAAPARLFGGLSQLFMIVKGLPSSYDKDLQEDKGPLFRGIEDSFEVLRVAALAVDRIAPNEERMRAAINPALFATDLIDYLMDRKIPFRDAHGIVGRIVEHAETAGKRLPELGLEDFRKFHPAFGPDVFGVFDPNVSIARKKTEGSTAPESVRLQVGKAKQCLSRTV
ncbi:MAG: argininosuccinate lyase [Candidatus Aminicenantales bacterium]